ncbi:MAG: hypothetical protein ACJ76I_02650 [Gaiellaceae bacterium]
MGGPDDETQRLEVPAPSAETPASWERAEPRYFGLTPHLVAAFLAAVLLGAGVVLLVTGSLVVGLLLLLAALLLGAIYAEQARRRRSSALDRVAAAAVDHTRALAGFTGASVRAWTHASREIARLRLDASRCARRKSQLQYALGGAVYDGDEAEAGRLRAEMREADERIQACIAEAHKVVDLARSQTAREKLAVSQTEIRTRS